MMRKIRAFLETHEKEYELIRYVFAGGVTTLLSLAVYTLVCILVSPDHTVDGATQVQATAANVVSWVIAVLFAFWINRRMVFLRKGGETQTILKELGQFVLSRLASLLLFETGLFYLLATLGVSNTVNWWVKQILVTVFNYVVSKFWIFAKTPQSPQGTEACQEAETDCQASPEPPEKQ